MNEILEKIVSEALPIIERHGLNFYKSEVRTEFGSVFYTIFVDDPNENDLDIEIVQTINTELLDVVNDMLPDNGYLEVSSVGVERPLKTNEDFNKAIGKYIYVSLYEKLEKENEKEFYGYLTRLDDLVIEMDILVKTRHKQIIIERKKIAAARLAVKF